MYLLHTVCNEHDLRLGLFALYVLIIRCIYVLKISVLFKIYRMRIMYLVIQITYAINTRQWTQDNIQQPYRTTNKYRTQ